MKIKNGVLIAMAVLVVLALLSGCKSASKSYPSKAVSLVYHSSAGSGGDVFLRNLGKAVEKQFKQPIVVENRTGGGGSTAWTYVSKATADGYIMLGVSSTIVAGPLQTQMSVNWQTFKPVCQVMYDPEVIFISSKSSLKTWQDIVANAKANPGKQKWGGGSPGSVESLCLQTIFEKNLGTKIEVVPFNGGGEVAVEVLAGRLVAGIGEFGEVGGLIKSGDLLPLCILSNARLTAMPNLPTLKELGTNFAFEKARGIMAPKDTPDVVIQKWQDACKKAIDDPDYKKYYTDMNIIPQFRSAADFAKTLADQEAFLKSAMGK